MTNRERVTLLVSLAISLLYWGWTYGAYLGSIFVVSLLIHEYGHYYWMGREGILNRSMMMVPPFGAIAFAKDMWPSRGAESRIALAGPAFGILSIAVPLLGWLIYRDELSRAGIFLVCIINLFNLCLPIAILDGGRVIKSLLFSINRSLGIFFYHFSVILLFLFVLWFLNIFTILMGFLLYVSLKNEFRAVMTDPSFINLALMSKSEMFNSLLSYSTITIIFILILFGNGFYLADLFNLMRN